MFAMTVLKGYEFSQKTEKLEPVPESTSVVNAQS